MKKRSYPLMILLTLSLCVTASDEAVSELDYSDHVLYLHPLSAYDQFTLTVNGPAQIKYRHHFEGDETPQLSLYDPEGKPLPDGQYTFELKASPIVSEAMRTQLIQARSDGVVPEQLPEGKTQSGSFYVTDGTIVLPENKGDELGSAVLPVGDWRLMATNGVPNYFSIEDSNASLIPFRVEAGAPDHSLYVDDEGALGIGTSTPQKAAHIISGNAPTLRLEQDGSEGFGTQTWDLTSNEANFYIGDASNGNKLPLRIEVNSPTNSLYIATNGVGLNTYDPSARLDVVGSSELNGDVTVTGATTLNGLTVSGTAALGNVSLADVSVSGAARLNGLIASGDTRLNDLTVTGTSSLANVSAAAVSVSGATTLNGLTVSGTAALANVSAAAVFANDVSVSGATSLNGLTVTGTSALANLSVADVFANDVSVSGATSLNGLTVTGTSALANLSVADVFANDVSASGATSLNGLTVTGTAALANLSATDVTVSGSTTVNDITVGGAIALNGGLSVAGDAVDLTVRDTTTTPGERSLMKLENYGRTWLDFANTYRDNRWQIGADHFGFRIRDNSPTGQSVFMEFTNTGNVSVWSSIGEHLRITSTGDLVIRGEILTGGGVKPLSAENDAMKLQIKALEEQLAAQAEQLAAQEARLQALETASGKIQVTSGK